MEVIPYFDYSLYQMFHMFVFWSVVGWGIEICYMTLETGEYQNRGFLSGPMCPIYGFGVLMVVIFFRPLEHTVIPLFLVTMLLCTLFELAVGVGMEKLFNNRWWDYSHERFNFKGYVCLKVSIWWGLGCVLVVKVVHPLVEDYVNWLPVKLGLVIIVVISILIIIDVISSITAVNNLNMRLKQIDEISNLMLKSAVIIGGNLSNETLEIKGKYDKIVEATDNRTNAIKEKYDNAALEIKEKYDNKSQELREKYDSASVELREKLEKLTNTKDATVERWLKSFPNMRSVTYNESLSKMKESIRRRSNRLIKNKDNDDKSDFD